MIQRLGKHFPEAGGAMGSGVRDLQMTTIDPHDFEQPSLSFAGFGFPTFYEPEIQVWENVTFADNYYQTVPQLRNNLTGTPAGRAIPDADLNVFLGGTVQPEVSGNVRREDSRAGFTRETDAILGLGRGAVHGRTVSWYDGTVDLSETEAPEALYRRLGDSFHEHLFDPNLANNSEFESGLANPWYVPDHTATNFALEDESAPHEGIGTGWFYSVLGGGKDLRPEARLDRRQPVTFDNTNGEENRGDAAVPDVFNGNFEITTAPDSPMASTLNREGAIPGWSFYNESVGSSQDDSIVRASASSSVPTSGFKVINKKRKISLQKIAEKHEIFIDHLEKINLVKDNGQIKPHAGHAIEINPGEVAKHNHSKIPFEDLLRFDLFVPESDKLKSDDLTSFVKVSINGKELKSSNPFEYDIQNPIDKPRESLPLEEAYHFNAERPAVDLRTYTQVPEYPSAIPTQGQFNRVDYARHGFETFYVDVPEDLQGHQGQIEISVEGKIPVYFDNLGFGSDHLKFGIPTLKINEQTKQKATTDVDSANNYLIHKPSYSLSFNKDIKSPNWVSYQLNSLWHDGGGNPPATRPNNRFFAEDIALPTEDFGGSSFKRPISSNYSSLPLKFERGHLVASSDRNRAQKDQDSTFILSNILPQESIHENDPWSDLEKYLQIETKTGQDIYILAGGIPFSDEEKKRIIYDSEPLKNLKKAGIDFPEFMWKVALVLDNQNINKNVKNLTTGQGGIVNAIAIIVPNDPLLPEDRFPKTWFSWRTSIDRVENLTGLDFFTNLDKNLEERIEAINPGKNKKELFKS
ncbi:DNA/RNA non-specific endonuclease [Geitlerinema sp. CS-897]|nr:DNA/RNA non-specific endonuclease [Geitlerinema sp. CS-897]